MVDQEKLKGIQALRRGVGNALNSLLELYRSLCRREDEVLELVPAVVEFVSPEEAKLLARTTPAWLVDGSDEDLEAYRREAEKPVRRAVSPSLMAAALGASWQPGSGTQVNAPPAGDLAQARPRGGKKGRALPAFLEKATAPRRALGKGSREIMRAQLRAPVKEMGLFVPKRPASEIVQDWTPVKPGEGRRDVELDGGGTFEAPV